MPYEINNEYLREGVGGPTDHQHHLFNHHNIKEMKEHLYYPEAIQWMWNYCIYLGPFTSSDNTNYDLGATFTHGAWSAACVYDNKPGSYLSGDINKFDGDIYKEVKQRLQSLNLNI